jgi:hypothetical protein
VDWYEVARDTYKRENPNQSLTKTIQENDKAIGESEFIEINR